MGNLLESLNKPENSFNNGNSFNRTVLFNRPDVWQNIKYDN